MHYFSRRADLKEPLTCQTSGFEMLHYKSRLTSHDGWYYSERSHKRTLSNQYKHKYSRLSSTKAKLNMLNNSDIFNHPDIGYNYMVTPLVLKFVSVSFTSLKQLVQYTHTPAVNITVKICPSLYKITSPRSSLEVNVFGGSNSSKKSCVNIKQVIERYNIVYTST